MGRRTNASTLLLAMLLATDPYIQPAKRRGTFVPEQSDYADYPEGRSVRVALPSGTLVATVAGVTHGLLKLNCKPLGKLREGQVLSIGGNTFKVKRVAMASMLLRPEARPV